MRQTKSEDLGAPGVSVPTVFSYGESSQLRTIEIQNVPWFAAVDACKILEISDTNSAVRKLDDDEKMKAPRKVYGVEGGGDVWLVNESGLYHLIFRSNKPEAKAFRKWVTTEVLPQIRKTGSYVPKPDLSGSEGSQLEPGQMPEVGGSPDRLSYREFNGRPVALFKHEGKLLYRMTDVVRAMGRDSRKEANYLLRARYPDPMAAGCVLVKQGFGPASTFLPEDVVRGMFMNRPGYSHLEKWLEGSADPDTELAVPMNLEQLVMTACKVDNAKLRAELVAQVFNAFRKGGQI